jgi:predicted dehydrogenase
MAKLLATLASAAIFALAGSAMADTCWKISSNPFPQESIPTQICVSEVLSEGPGYREVYAYVDGEKRSFIVEGGNEYQPGVITLAERDRSRESRASWTVTGRLNGYPSADLVHYSAELETVSLHYTQNFPEYFGLDQSYQKQP